MAKVAGFRFYYVFSDLTRNSTACTVKIRPPSTEMEFASFPSSGFTVATVENRLDKNWQILPLCFFKKARINAWRLHTTLILDPCIYLEPMKIVHKPCIFCQTLNQIASRAYNVKSVIEAEATLQDMNYIY